VLNVFGSATMQADYGINVTLFSSRKREQLPSSVTALREQRKLSVEEEG